MFKNLFNKQNSSNQTIIKLNCFEIKVEYNKLTLQIDVIDFKCDFINGDQFPLVWGKMYSQLEENVLNDFRFESLFSGWMSNRFKKQTISKYLNKEKNIKIVDDYKLLVLASASDFLQLFKSSFRYEEKIKIKQIQYLQYFLNNYNTIQQFKSKLDGIELIMNMTIAHKNKQIKELSEFIDGIVDINDWQPEYKLTDDEFESIKKQIFN